MAGGALQLLGQRDDVALGLRGLGRGGVGLDARQRAGTGDADQVRVEGAADDVAGGVDARVLQQTESGTALVRQDQRDDRAGAAGARGAAGAVQVVLVVTGRVDVQHQVDAVDVDASGGDVGGDQDVDVAVLEVAQGPGTGALGHAAVQRVGLHARVAELLGDAVGAHLGADEDDGAALAGGDGVGDRGLVLGLHDQDVVGHGGDRAGGGVDLVGDRVHQVALHQGVDLVLQGRGEEHPLAAGGDLVEDLGDLGQEAHVGHLVGLVEDDDLDLVEGAGAAVDQVTQAAGGGDEDVDTALQRPDLLRHGGTAADDLEVQAEHGAVGLQRVGDLHRQLAGRDQDQAARALGPGAALLQTGQQRQAEAQRLAGAGAAAAEHVLAGQRVRDGGGLDRERGGHAALGETADDLVRQTEVTEGDRLLGLSGLGGGGGGVGLNLGGLDLDQGILRILGVFGHGEAGVVNEGHQKPSGCRHAPTPADFPNRLNAVSHGVPERARCA